MKIGVLTSSRSDFGILKPLVDKLLEDSFFDTHLIVFGSHLSKKGGYTVTEIIEQGYPISTKIETAPNGDAPLDIAKSMGNTITKFSDYWSENNYDLVVVLGDRYEMFAAVSAASPFNIKFAHIHAGETTLGAIDNFYRHSISLMSNLFFVTTEEYKKRTNEIVKDLDHIYNVGALSIDNLVNEKLYTVSDFKSIFNIDLNYSTILSTYHPETISYERNLSNVNEFLYALKILAKNYQVIITMPNLDTQGLLIRTKITDYFKNEKNIYLIESFGMKGYLSCMAQCKMMIGNTSSGFVEASYFPKWVINIGVRQQGRIVTPNIINVIADSSDILKSVKTIEKSKLPKVHNIYGDGNAALRIIETIKKIYAN